MNKFYIACAILVPLAGCTGEVNGGAPDSLGPPTRGATGGNSSSSNGGNSSSSNGGNSSSFGGAGGGSSGSNGSGSTAGTAAGGAGAAGGVSSFGGNSNTGVCSTDALPAGLQTMLTNKCAGCHGPTPLTGLPSLESYANLTAASKSDPSKTNAVVALTRIQSTTAPMPPAPGTPATASEIRALQDFISQGYPRPNCSANTGGTGGGGVAGGGAAGGGGTSVSSGGASGSDPLFAMPTCTSMITWKGGNNGSASMNPGMACNACHKSGDGPTFSIAGTVYPTGHEPDLCNSTSGTAGARVVITGADGAVVTLAPNAAGNFSSNTSVKSPFQAKVTYQGRERLMLLAQTSGDCNSCHSQSGSNGAPGRIVVP